MQLLLPSCLFVLLQICACVSISTVNEADKDLNLAWMKKLKRSQDDKCTAIAVGSGATTDGSTITTHNNDCQECDVRITHVPAMDWAEGRLRPIFAERVAYPRFLENLEDNVHGPDYLFGNHDKTIFDWEPSKPLGYIPQVPHTYAYTMGSYAIQNEKQLSMGESTCGAKFVSNPPSIPGGKALLNLHALNELAMERCDSAICAIKTMGELAETYGYYGPGGDGELASAQEEAGEALTIADKTSAWMFHILPDDTGASAIWVAQRVPEDHITAVANMFVIGEIDINDTNNFLASTNIFDVAIRNNLWDPNSGEPFSFRKAYAPDSLKIAQFCNRRIWRIFTLAAPTIANLISPFTNTYETYGFGADELGAYPFSIKPDNKLGIRDIMSMMRDYYEGTVFDLTNKPDAGPFGDPLRYMPTPWWVDLENSVEWEVFEKGIGYPRPISLWRTAYSTVTQSRSNLPDNIGAVAWISQSNPATAVYLPVYAAASQVPSTMRYPTQYKTDKSSTYWIFTIVSNYAARYYSWTIKTIRAKQAEVENKIITDLSGIETEAYAYRDVEAALNDFLWKQHESIAVGVRDTWFDFFFELTAKFRDGFYLLDDWHTENFLWANNYISIPKWWLEMQGYWGKPLTPPPGADHGSLFYPLNYPEFNTHDEYKAAFPHGVPVPYPPAVSEVVVPPVDAPTPARTRKGHSKGNVVPPSESATLGTYVEVASHTNWGSMFLMLCTGLGMGMTIMYVVMARARRMVYLPLK